MHSVTTVNPENMSTRITLLYVSTSLYHLQLSADLSLLGSRSVHCTWPAVPWSTDQYHRGRTEDHRRVRKPWTQQT